MSRKKVADTKEFKLSTIYFYLTEGCNLACRHCWIKPHFQNGTQVYPSLDINLFKSIISQALPLGLSGVKLTGGEPFLHPDIFEILKHIRENSLNLVIETNGVLCTAAIVQELKLHKQVYVSVSVDGAKAETHEWVRGVKGSFDGALQGVRNLAAGGYRPQIIMSIMKHNRDEIEPLVRLAESLGAGSVKFNIVQPTARGEAMHEMHETLSLQELIEVGEWVENQLSKTSKIKLIYSHPIVFRPLSKIFGGNGCGICNIFHIIGVLASGSYALCGIGESVKEMVFGHAAKDRLADIWHNNPMLLEIRDGLPAKLEGICAKCMMKSRCFGNCLAQNYYRTGSLWGDYWYCAEAEKLGLFPKTRIV